MTVLIVLAVAVAAATAANRRSQWVKRAWTRCQQLYWQHRISGRVQARGQMAFSRDSVRRSADHLDGFAGPISMFHGDCGGTHDSERDRFSAVLPPIDHGSVDPSLPGLPAPTLFVGLLRSTTGDRFVCVRLQAQSDAAYVNLAFEVTVVTPAALGHEPRAIQFLEALDSNPDRPETPSVGSDWSSDDTDITSINRGVAIGTDPSRFTSEYTTKTGRRHSIEGAMSAAGDSVTFAYLAMPNTSASTAPIATPAAGR